MLFSGEGMCLARKEQPATVNIILVRRSEVDGDEHSKNLRGA